MGAEQHVQGPGIHAQHRLEGGGAHPDAAVRQASQGVARRQRDKNSCECRRTHKAQQSASRMQRRVGGGICVGGGRRRLAWTGASGIDGGLVTC